MIRFYKDKYFIKVEFAFVLILFLFSFASCAKKSVKTLSGDDTEDLIANTWLRQENYHDFFISFDDDGKGWAAEVINSAIQRDAKFPKISFTYNIDTLNNTISLVYDETKEKIFLNYQFEFEGQPYLYLNNIQYIDASPEIMIFESRSAEDTEEILNVVSSILELLKEFI